MRVSKVPGFFSQNVTYLESRPRLLSRSACCLANQNFSMAAFSEDEEDSREVEELAEETAAAARAVASMNRFRWGWPNMSCVRVSRQMSSILNWVRHWSLKENRQKKS